MSFIQLFPCLFPELLSNEGNTQQNNTCVGAWTVRHISALLYFLYDIMNLGMMIQKMILTQWLLCLIDALCV